MFMNISTIEKRMLTWNLKRLTMICLIIGLIITLIGSYFWYTRLYMDNERRFWAAIENSLSTSSVTRTLSRGGSGNAVVQNQRFVFAPQMVTESKVFFTQRGATVNTTVVTEGIQYPDAQYSRYTEFTTDQVREDGVVPTLDSLLNKWEESQVPEQAREQARLSYISELVTLAIFGNYDAEFRSDIIDGLQDSNAYTIDFDRARDSTIGDDDVIVYSVVVNLKPYATQLQRAFERSGYGEFPPLNPDNYQDDSDLSTSIAIYKKNNAIASISFGDREEMYTGYGVQRTVERPQSEFSQGELEQAVQRELQGVL